MTGGTDLPADTIALIDQITASGDDSLRRVVAALRSARENLGSRTAATLAVARALHGTLAPSVMLTLLISAINEIADDDGYETDPIEEPPL